MCKWIGIVGLAYHHQRGLDNLRGIFGPKPRIDDDGSI